MTQKPSRPLSMIVRLPSSSPRPVGQNLTGGEAHFQTSHSQIQNILPRSAPVSGMAVEGACTNGLSPHSLEQGGPGHSRGGLGAVPFPFAHREACSFAVKYYDSSRPQCFVCGVAFRRGAFPTCIVWGGQQNGYMSHGRVRIQ